MALAGDEDNPRRVYRGACREDFRVHEEERPDHACGELGLELVLRKSKNGGGSAVNQDLIQNIGFLIVTLQVYWTYMNGLGICVDFIRGIPDCLER